MKLEPSSNLWLRHGSNGNIVTCGKIPINRDYFLVQRPKKIRLALYNNLNHTYSFFEPLLRETEEALQIEAKQRMKGDIVLLIEPLRPLI